MAGVVRMADADSVTDMHDKTEKLKMVLPGDLIGISEEYTAGEGAFDENGNIYSTVVGTVVENQKKRVIGVKPLGNTPPVVKKGDVVYGLVSGIRSSVVLLDLAFIKGHEDRQIAGDVQAAIHVSNVKKSYVSELKHEFGYNDIVKGRIIDPATLRVDTSDPEHGVIKAFCSRCKIGMRRKNKVLECPNCERSETRKISTEYGMGLV